MVTGRHQLNFMKGIVKHKIWMFSDEQALPMDQKTNGELTVEEGSMAIQS